MIKISVIIPVFNCDFYLQEALDSIVDQTIIDDIEVIMVDNGSTDDSKYIIEKYAIDFDNFHAYHIENQGVTFARNFGLDLAKGEYIHFMDGDDYLPCEAYEKLYDLASKYGHDIVTGNFLRFNGRRTWSIGIPEFIFKNIDGNIDETSLAENKVLTWDMFLWNKLFKRSFLNEHNVRFPNQNLTYQDNLFSIQAYTYSKTVGILTDYVYFWRSRDSKSSITQVFTKKWVSDRFTILNMVHDFISQNISDNEILYYKYSKWLTIDLPNIIKRFNEFPEGDHEFLFDNINKIVNLVPREFFCDLNSYNQVLFDMIQNEDWDDFMEFISHDLKKYPDESLAISDKYKNRLDLKSDGLSEKLVAKISSVSSDDRILEIEFDYSINYISDNEPHECEVFLVDSKGNELPVSSPQNGVLAIDVDSLDVGDYSVKVRYNSKFFDKESFLMSNTRKIFDWDDDWVEINCDEMRFITLSKHEKGETKVFIDNVDFTDNLISFNCESNKKFEKLISKNTLSFKEYDIPVDFKDNALSFHLSFDEHCKVPVKRWELSLEEDLCELRLNRNYEYCYEKYLIKVKNYGNKIIIEFNLYDKFEKINNLIGEKKEFQLQNKKLKRKNEKLKNKNENLKIKLKEKKEIIELFNSRKDVRFVNKVKKSPDSIKNTLRLKK